MPEPTPSPLSGPPKLLVSLATYNEAGNLEPLVASIHQFAPECSVLVIDDQQRLSGIFTGRDAVHRVLAEGKGTTRTKLVDVMTRNPDTMPPRKMAIEALRMMEDGRYRHLPIVEDGKVVGIVSRFDFSGIELDRLDEETGLWERI